PGPSSTSSLWMLNQLRPASSLHNRFIDRSTCSRAKAGDPRRQIVEIKRPFWRVSDVQQAW
ncbi:hypothetical protein CN210_34035, partial [Sinorhizobium meliloti]